MTYRTILFDFDGTLTPSLELWLQAFQHALRQYKRELTEATIIGLFYREFDAIADEFDLPSGTEFRRHVHEGLTAAFSSPRLFPGVREVLNYCRAKDLPLGLVTSSPRRHTLQMLERLDLARFFPVVVTGDDITHHKPHPEPVEKALRQLGQPADGTLFIGDYTADMIAGHAAGTKTALFLPEQHGRFYDFAMLHATQPDVVFTEYPELLAHLQVRAVS